MITRHPLGRQDLRIKRRDKVLEIGPGHDPMFRSDVIADKFPHDDTHRCGKVLIYPHQQFIEADGEQLPFEKDAFDYVICNQVLEHADNPARFIEEMVRVGKRGYVETPSMLGEQMFPKESHRWVILLIEDKLVFYEKEKMPGNYRNNYGEVFLNYLPYQSLPFKMLYVSEPNLLLNRIEWEGTIEYLRKSRGRLLQQFLHPQMEPGDDHENLPAAPGADRNKPHAPGQLLPCPGETRAENPQTPVSDHARRIPRRTGKITSPKRRFKKAVFPLPKISGIELRVGRRTFRLRSPCRLRCPPSKTKTPPVKEGLGTKKRSDLTI